MPSEVLARSAMTSRSDAKHVSTKAIKHDLTNLGVEMGYTKPLPADEEFYDNLDMERENMDLEGLDDVLKSVNDPNMPENEKSRIQHLERSLEQEKRRLAAMECELQDAKKQQTAENQMVVVRKANEAIYSMVVQLSRQTKEEAQKKQSWEREWKEQMRDFHLQHREMEEALKRKHVEELKRLQDEFQKAVVRIQQEAQRSKGRKVPSPQALAELQETNMARVVAVYQRQAEERAFLAHKVARQEDLLMRSRSQSLQRFLSDAQGKHAQLFRKFHPKRAAAAPPALNLNMSAPAPAFADASPASAHSSVFRQDSRSPRSSARTSFPAEADAPARGATGGSSLPRTRRSVRLPPASPRMDDTATTFLTSLELEDPEGLEGEEEEAEEGRGGHSFDSDARAPPPLSAVSHRRTQPANARFEEEEEEGGGGEEADGGARGAGRWAQLQHGDQAALARQYGMEPAATRRPVFKIAGSQRRGGGGGLPMPGTEATGWRRMPGAEEGGGGERGVVGVVPSAEEVFGKEERTRPEWDGRVVKESFVAQVVAPVYGADPFQPLRRSQKPSLGPYLAPPAGKRAGRGRRGGGRPEGQGGGRGPGAEGGWREEGGSMGGRLAPLGTMEGPRSMSTDPRLEGGGRGEVREVGMGESTTFPHLEGAVGQRGGGKGAGAEEGLFGGGGEESAMKARLEAWVNDKIVAILGNAAPPGFGGGGEEKKGGVRFPEVEGSGGRKEGKGEEKARDGKAGGGEGEKRGDGEGLTGERGRREEAGGSAGGRGNIGALLGRLKASMAGAGDGGGGGGGDGDGEEERGGTRGVLRRASSGMKMENRDERRAAAAEEVRNAKGKEVTQLYEDDEVFEVQRGEEKQESARLEGRRAELERLQDATPTPKTPKRVGWKPFHDETEYERDDVSEEGGTDGRGVGMARPGTGYTESTLGSTRAGMTDDDESPPATGYTASASGYASSRRPETGGTGLSSTWGSQARPETGSTWGPASGDEGQTTADEGTETEGEGDGGEGTGRERGRVGEEGGEASTVKELLACARHNKVDGAEELLVKGVDPNSRDEFGNTSLIVAAQNGHKRLVKMCLRYGAEPNASNHHGNTALHFSTSYGYTALSKYLISKGADDTVINHRGYTCYDGLGEDK